MPINGAVSSIGRMHGSKNVWFEFLVILCLYTNIDLSKIFNFFSPRHEVLYILRVYNPRDIVLLDGPIIVLVIWNLRVGH